MESALTEPVEVQHIVDTQRVRPRDGVVVDWLVRLKAAYEAGFYRTEEAVGAQSAFPWQNKTCKNCPFWSNSYCQVHGEYRNAAAHTCSYFDEKNRTAAREHIQERQWRSYRRWWEWFNDRGALR